MKNEKGCKDMYKILNEKVIVSKSQEKWGKTFENIELKWKLIYNIPVKCCNNTKLHWFQYRIFHRILATNDLLMKFKIKQDNSCSFCKQFPEKIEHLFWYCEIVQEFWDKIEYWISDKSEYIVNIHKHSAIFGIPFNKIFNIPVNYILILTRYYIYKCRIYNKQLNLKAWKNEVKNFLQIEKMVAIKNDNYEKFAKDWEEWILLFEGENE